MQLFLTIISLIGIGNNRRAVKIILIRHGETFWNLEDKIQGLHDSPLTPFGVKQAEKTAERLKNEPIDMLLSSTLGRAIHTAEIIRDSINGLHGKEILTFPELNERDYGILTGMTKQEVARRKLLPKWYLFRYFFPPKDGESVIRQNKRIRNFLTNILKEYPGKDILIVTHAGPLKMIVALLLKKNIKWMMRFRPLSGSVTILVNEGNKWKERLLNDVSHLHSLRSLFELK